MPAISTRFAAAALIALAGTAVGQTFDDINGNDQPNAPAVDVDRHPLVDPAELAHPHNPRTILLRLSENARETHPDLVQNLINALGQTDHTYRSLPGLMSVSLNDNLTVADALQQARSTTGLIEYAEADYLRFNNASATDPLYDDMWHLHNTGQFDGAQSGFVGADINAEAAWDIFTGDPNFILGVIDGGIDPDHPDLADNMWTNPDEIPGNGIDDDNNGYIDDVHGWDFFDNDNDPSNSAAHGTHVSGTIAAQANNNIGITGVMWEAQVIALKFIGPFSGSTSDAIAAIDYAFNEGVRLTNNSWGGGGFSQGLKDAIDNLATIDSIFVAASGNDFASSASYPARYDSPNIISVDGSDNRDQPYAAGNSNPVNVDIAAPAVRVLSSVPGGYDRFTGTSMASPHVAGVVGLVTAYAPALDYQQIKQIVMDTARPVAAFNGLSVTGAIVDAEAALLGTDVAPVAAVIDLPQTALPGASTPITIQVLPGTQGFVSGSVELLYQVNGGALQTAPATPAGPDTFTANIPPVFCGDQLAVAASVQSAQTGDVTMPDGFSDIPVGEVLVSAQDSFNNDNGWTVSNSPSLTAGAWERGQPVNFNRGNPTSDSDGSGFAFLTDNDPNTDNSDVDNGTTTVTSPIYDVSGGATLSYDYWLNDVSGGPLSPEDTLLVEVSTNGGSSWSDAREYNTAAGSWRNDQIEVAPTTQFRVRFTVGDLGDQNVVEAAIDNILISSVVCNDPPSCPTDFDNSGATDLPDLLAVLGNFGDTVDAGTDGDTSGDGLVDLNDLLNLLNAFGDDC